MESSLLCGNNGSNAPAEERYKTTKLCDLFVLRRPNEEITIRTTRFKNRSKRALVARSGIYSSVSLAILLGTLLSLPFSRAFACFWMVEMVRWSFRFDWMRIYYFSSILIIIPRENRWNVSLLRDFHLLPMVRFKSAIQSQCRGNMAYLLVVDEIKFTSKVGLLSVY